MNDKIIQRKLVKIICECCGQEFYAEAGTNFCSECEKHWNEN